jgi:hypothetical protein
MNMPSRKVTSQLGKRTADVAELDEHYGNEKQKAVEEAIKLQDQLEDEGIIDRYKRLQSTRHEVNEDLIGAEIEILYSYVEPHGRNKNMWCQGVNVAVLTRNKIHEWDVSTLHDGDESITEEVLFKTRYNKHVIGGCRYSIE